MSEEKQNASLRKAIDKLPSFAADDRVWERIEEELSRAEEEAGRPVLKNALRSLPVFAAPVSRWEEIERKISEPSDRKIKKNILFFLRMAAFFLLLFGLLFFMDNIWRTRPLTQLAFSTETMGNYRLDKDNSDLEMSMKAVLAGHCRNEPEVCTDPRFTELKNELSDLDESLEDLNKRYRESDKDPEIFKYLLRAQKEKMEISKKLLHYFNN